MDAKLKKEIREKLEERFDKIVFHKDGTATAKRSFFYTHGNSADKMAEKLIEMLAPKAVKIESTNDNWQTWPKTSYFEVKFSITA